MRNVLHDHAAMSLFENTIDLTSTANPIDQRRQPNYPLQPAG